MRFERSAVELKPFRMLRAAALALAAPRSGWPGRRRAEPAFSDPGTVEPAPGTTLTYSVTDLFDNAGTNPVFTSVGFAQPHYLVTFGFVPSRVADRSESFDMTVKTSAQLNALPSPPPSPFTFTADVSMTNDEEQTALGTITFRTTYDRATQPPAPPPTFSLTDKVAVPPGQRIFIYIADMFDNPGAGAEIETPQVDADERALYKDISSGAHHSDRFDYIMVWAWTAAQLNAMTPPPPSPFTADVAVTMNNDAGQTASGTVVLETTYVRVEPEAPPPSFSHSGTADADPGETLTYNAGDLFDNAGTLARISQVELSPEGYYSVDNTKLSRGVLQFTVMTAAELNALETPPDSPPSRSMSR